ncbi:MAG: response regulator transcription factor [Culicoidibacterales bacterium]
MTILLVDDEPRFQRLLGDFLQKAGYQIVTAENGKIAIEYLTTHPDVSLIVLDVMMPILDGFETCRQIRTFSQVPIVMVTAKDQEYDEIQGLKLGADDYVSKPFSPKVLVARIERLLKRQTNESNSSEQAIGGNIWQMLDFQLDFAAHRLKISGKIVELSPKEYDILTYLIEHEHQVVMREVLLDRIWGYDYSGDVRTVDTHMNRLRIKLSPYSEWIQTVRGKGYRFEVISS